MVQHDIDRFKKFWEDYTNSNQWSTLSRQNQIESKRAAWCAWKAAIEEPIKCTCEMKTKEYEYAKDLATHLWEAHYKADASEWEPLNDLMGVLTQIDNMIVGLKRGSTI